MSDESLGDEPRAFISYSWTSVEHQEWVMDLAKDLVGAAVDVVLDKWALREGQDKYHFMEQMVVDPTVKKVILVCDRRYAEKAHSREGGVGTESQIVSKDIYESVDQTKFVAVVTEFDGDGNPYTPAFFKSRVYIDMSSPSKRYDNFEQLLRWIYDKPLHERPALGRKPSFLDREAAVGLGTAGQFQRASDAVTGGKPTARAAVADFFETFAANLETLRLSIDSATPFDEQVLGSIDAFLPYRDQFVDLLLNASRYLTDDEIYALLHQFYESIIGYTLPPRDISSYRDDQFDNFKFAVHELFLYGVAALLKNKRFSQARRLMEQPYYVSEEVIRGAESGLQSFEVFRSYLKSLGARNERLNLRRLSVTSDVLKERSKRQDLSFENIMEADFVLFLWSVLHHQPYHLWFPDTLLYACNYHPAFELFQRGASRAFFPSIGTLLGVEGADELVARVKKGLTDHGWGVPWQSEEFDTLHLMNADKLASRA